MVKITRLKKGPVMISWL